MDQFSSRSSNRASASKVRNSSRTAVARAAARAVPRIPMFAESLEPRRLLAVDFEFTIIDPGGGSAAYYDDINRTLSVAGDDWGSRFDSTATIEVDVLFEFAPDENFLAKAGSYHFEPLRVENGVDIGEVGGVHEIRTGTDPNAESSDGRIIFNTALIDDFFWDPAPLDRNDSIPAGEYDAYSILIHEIGHIIGFAGYKDGETGDVVFGQMTTYDELVSGSDGTFVWTGENATELYGRNPPLATGSISHYGNEGGPGGDLDDLLMSASISPGERQYITDIDLAFLLDMGLPVIYDGGEVPPPPVPPTIDVVGTNRDDIIEVIHTNLVIIINITNYVDKQLYNPYTGEYDTYRDYETKRTDYASEGFTNIIIRGLGGDDRIFVNNDMPACTLSGDAGNDTIIGGNGNDTLIGGSGRDHLYGGYGEDRLDGGSSNDYLVGGFDSDRLFGGRDNDQLDGSAGEDDLYGGGGDDILIGAKHNDQLFGESGNDQLYGADGRDTMDGGSGGDLFEGGPGIDTADYTTRVANLIVTIDEQDHDGEIGERDNVTFSTENIWGGMGDDRLGGTGANNVILGNEGRDAIDGGTGNDHLDGGASGDRIDGMIGRDTIFGGGGADRINAGPDADEVYGGAGNDIIFSIDRAPDIVYGGSGQNSTDADTRDEINESDISSLVTTR